MELYLELEGNLDQIDSTEFNKFCPDAIVVSKKSIYGVEVTEIITYLGSASLGFFAKFILEKVKANSLRAIKIDGIRNKKFESIEIKGISEDEILKILKEFQT